MASGRKKNKGKWYHKSAIVMYKRSLGPYLTLSKLWFRTVILARSVCLHSLNMALVMRLKGKECILENQTDSVKAEDEILYI